MKRAITWQNVQTRADFNLGLKFQPRGELGPRLKILACNRFKPGAGLKIVGRLEVRLGLGLRLGLGCVYTRVCRYPVNFSVHYNIHYIMFTILVRETWNDYQIIHEFSSSIRASAWLFIIMSHYKKTKWRLWSQMPGTYSISTPGMKSSMSVAKNFNPVWVQSRA
jgi:hypothetical protein